MNVQICEVCGISSEYATPAHPMCRSCEESNCECTETRKIQASRDFGSAIECWNAFMQLVDTFKNNGIELLDSVSDTCRVCDEEKISDLIEELLDKRFSEELMDNVLEFLSK